MVKPKRDNIPVVEKRKKPWRIRKKENQPCYGKKTSVRRWDLPTYLCWVIK